MLPPQMELGYERMHQRLAALYEDCCPDCGAIHVELSGGKGGKERIPFDSLLNAFKRVFKRQRMTPEMLGERPIREAIDTTARVLTEAIAPVLEYKGTPPAMQRSLREDVYIFSGFKTYHELRQAAALLVDSSGQIKSFEQYLRDVRKIHDQYNRAYLESEYIYAVGAAESAREWQKLEANGSLDEYDLQYRTAADGRVRPDHVMLEGITLSGRDPFWDLFYPPNGWRCRCVARRVIPGLQERTPSELAIGAGMAATAGKNSIFRMNPGKQAVIFPRSHPYYGKQGYGHCITQDGREQLRQPIGSKDVCKVLAQCYENLDGSKEKEGEYKKARKEARRVCREEFAGKEYKPRGAKEAITVTNTGIKEYINQPFFDMAEKFRLAGELDKLIESSRWLGELKRREGDVKRSFIAEVEISGKRCFLIFDKHYDSAIRFYGISDSEDLDKYLL